MKPPKFPLRFLRWFCKPYYVDAIEGDLLELFNRESGTEWKARLKFFWNTIRFLRWRFIKSPDDFKPKSSYGMLKNYLKVSFRNIKKHKVHSVLNILGLSVGITSCLLIILHVTTQLKFDKHIADIDRIYRVVLNQGGPYTPARLVKQMQEDYPEIEAGTRVNGTFEAVINLGDDFVTQDGCIIADSTFFDVFPTTFLHGNPENTLNDPKSVVITASVARKLFNKENAVGDFIEYNGDKYNVSGVVVDQPETSTIPYEVIIPIPHEYWATTGWWTGNNFFSYLKLKKNTSAQALEAKLHEFVKKYIAPEILKFSDQFNTFEEYLASGRQHSFQLIPMSEIHLEHSRLTMNKPGSLQNVIIFSMVALFILVIASINYINMSTAKSSLRAKEIGMRKVMGSGKSAIAYQFFVESFLITFFAVILGLIFAILIIPFFNNIADSSYTWYHLLTTQIIVGLLMIFFFVGLISGTYPAMYLSSFKPIVALRGENVRGGKKLVRVGLVVFQFAISIALLSGTFIVYHQVNLMSERNLGLNASQTFVVESGTKVLDRFDAFSSELTKQNSIEKVGLSNQFPSMFISDWNYKTMDENPITLSPFNLFVSSEIDEIWGLDVLKGRFFDKNMAIDTGSIIVNEEFVKQAGWKDPIGKTLTRGQGSVFRVIGMIKDFKTGSAKRGKYPLVLRYSSPEKMADVTGSAFIMVTISGNFQESIAHINKVWDQFVSGYPFEGYFMDDSFDRLYDSERRFGKLFFSFSAVAILIAIIGLFALASFTLERRMKEIAIRKVLGASVSRVMGMVLFDFIKFILISSVIAIPVVYYLGNLWLEDYVQRIALNPVHFVVPVIGVVIISLLTVGYQTYTTAVDNPSNALKQE